MSLLLEALKKAELAKQAAKELPPATDRPPFTRDRLPDISQPMEIHSEDLGLAARARCGFFGPRLHPRPAFRAPPPAAQPAAPPVPAAPAPGPAVPAAT